MEVVDIWPKGVTPQGHTPGAWDCPCGPWILTWDGQRTIRHTTDLAPSNSARCLCERYPACPLNDLCPYDDADNEVPPVRELGDAAGVQHDRAVYGEAYVAVSNG